MKSFKKVLAVVLAVVMIFTCVAVSASATSTRKLDLVFVIDTTGSMSDDIYEVKVNMKNYLDDLDASGMDYSIAIVDYRDFPERTYDYSDYAYNVALDFDSDYNTINDAIDAVDLGNGGDWEETLYSALIDGLDELSWREKSGKAAIIMGDAPALDPEPITGYTLNDVKNKMLYNKIGVDDKREIETYALARATTTVERSAITLFTIATSEYDETIESFAALAESTNGKSYTAGDTAEISEIISEIIIEELPDVAEEEDEKSFLESVLEILRNMWLTFFYAITFQWELIP